MRAFKDSERTIMKWPNRGNYHCTIFSLATSLLVFAFAGYSGAFTAFGAAPQIASPRTRLSINHDWRFIKGDPPNIKTNLHYDAVKPWILPAGNNFLMDPARRAKRPDGNLGEDVPYTMKDFNDSSWRSIHLPHDYAIEGPFTTTVSGSTGRLPSSGSCVVSEESEHTRER